MHTMWSDYLKNGSKSSNTAKPHGKQLMGPKIYPSSRNCLSQGLLLCSIVSKS